MPNWFKRALVAALALASLALLVAGGLAHRLGTGVRSRVQAAASDALGMEVAIGGRTSVGIVHGLHISLTDVRVRRCGRDVAFAGEVDLGIDALALLHDELRIATLRLRQVHLLLERGRDRPLGPVRDCGARPPVPAPAAPAVVVSGPRLGNADAESGAALEATDCDGEVGGLTLAAGDGHSVVRQLSFAASGVCGQLRTHELTATGVKFSVRGRDGLVIVDPVSMRLLGGDGSGSVQADLTGAVPVYRVRYRLERFQIEEVFKALSLTTTGHGLLDFSATLSLRGAGTDEWLRTLAGEASLHGTELRLDIGDLDQRFSRYEASQNFNLVDVGAVFFLGPVGLGLTKGLDFARNLQAAGGSTTFETLVSEWQLEHGLARANDVALATRKSRIALRGNLDFVAGQFADVTVALLDASGCATVMQRVTGPFLAPKVEQPSVLKSLTGPTRRALGRIRTLLGGKCEVFYAGAVGAPR